MSVTRIHCQKCGYTLAWCECGKPVSLSAGATPDQGETKVVAAVPTGSGCSTCAHWKQTTRFNRPPFGMCMWRPDKRPSWFTTEGSTMLFETDGKTCETFTPNNGDVPTPVERTRNHS